MGLTRCTGFGVADYAAMDPSVPEKVINFEQVAFCDALELEKLGIKCVHNECDQVKTNG